MKLIVQSRYAAERSPAPNDPHVTISITNPGYSRPNPTRNEYTYAVKFMSFDDADRQINPTDAAWTVFDGNPVLFTPEMALDVVRFINEEMPWQGMPDEVLAKQTIRIHCEAGQSRSAGMAAALAKYYNGDDSEFFNNSLIIPYSHDSVYTPNMLVYRLTLEALTTVNGTPGWLENE